MTGGVDQVEHVLAPVLAPPRQADGLALDICEPLGVVNVSTKL